MKSLSLLSMICWIAITSYAQETTRPYCFYSFFGVCTDNANSPELGFWQKQESGYINEDGRRGNRIIPITPTNKDSVLARYKQIDAYTFKGRYETYSADFLQMILTVSDHDLQEYAPVAYLVEYWLFFLSSAANNPYTTGSVLPKLSSIELENYVKEPMYADSIRKHRLNARYNLYLSVNKYPQACAYKLELMQNNYSHSNDFQSYVQELFLLLLFKQDAGCKECVQKLKTVYIEEYNKNHPAWAAQSLNAAVETEIMLTDVISQYIQDDDLAKIAGEIKAYLADAISNEKAYFGKNNPMWYRLLNTLYVNGSLKERKNIAELKAQLQHFKGIGNLHTDDDKYIARMEYFCYYSLYQLIYENASPQDITPKLQEVERLGLNPSFKTYHHIEKHIASFILENINKNATDDRTPPKIALMPMPSKTESATVSLGGVIADESEILFLKINGEEVEIENDGSFSHSFPLVTGDNVLDIVCEDIFNNQQLFVHRISYEPLPDEFEKRKNTALLFAINDYDKETGWNDLSNPVSDAEKLAGELAQCGFDTLIVRNPSKDAFYQYMYRYAEMYAGEPLNKHSQFFLFYSGHGQYDKTFKRGYLAFKDSKQNDYKKESYVSYADIAEILDRFNCNHVLFISDACFSGAFFKNIAMKGLNDENNEITNEALKKMMEHKSRLFIGSAGLEESPDNSALMQSILEAFRRMDNGLLTYYQLMANIQNVKPAPSHGGFGENEPGSSFIFLKTDGKNRQTSIIR